MSGDMDQFADVIDDSDQARCISIVRGADVERVAEVFGADLGAELSLDEWLAWSDAIAAAGGGGNDVIQLAPLGDCIGVIEDNGWAGAQAPVAVELSKGGLFVSCYWSINFDMTFLYARSGEMVRSFDPLLYEAHENIWPSAENPPLAEERDLPFGDPDDCQVATFVLMERLTGVRLTHEWLHAERPTYRRIGSAWAPPP